jgi:hypothetical protein
MRTKATGLSGMTLMVALGLVVAGVAFAQQTITVDERNFEVISIEGNKLVVRDQKGTYEYTVPDDFRFTVGGKKVPVSELKAGMKGTATITTTTTVKPVVVTEVREGEVLRAAPMSVTVREPDGNVRRFTQGELDARGVVIIKDGRPTRVEDLRRGDKLTATIVTNGSPLVLTEKEVQATLAESKAEPPAPPTATVAAAQPAQPAASAPPAASPSPSALQPATRPAESSGMGMTWYVMIAVLIAVALFVFLRRRKGP